MQMQKEIFTVGEVNRYVKALLQQDLHFHRLLVRGENSNYTSHSS